MKQSTTSKQDRMIRYLHSKGNKSCYILNSTGDVFETAERNTLLRRIGSYYDKSDFTSINIKEYIDTTDTTGGIR